MLKFFFISRTQLTTIHAVEIIVWQQW
jgi:hypothetical protein